MSKGAKDAGGGLHQEWVPMLVPLVQLFMRAGLGAGAFSLASKFAFIRVAAESATIANRLNVSAIAASTGLTRKEVRSLLSMLDKARPVPRRDVTLQRTARVLQGWITDPVFHDREGVPKPLPMRDGDVSFEGLVQRFAGDVTPVSVLRELQRAGSVSRGRDGLIRVRKQSTRHRGYSCEVLQEISAHVADLAATLVGNIDRPQQPTYAGFQEIDQVPEDVARVFSAVFAERAGLLLEGVTRWYGSQKGLIKKNKSAARRRVGIGIYFVDEAAGMDPAKLPAPPLQRRSRNKRRSKVRKSGSP